MKLTLLLLIRSRFSSLFTPFVFIPIFLLSSVVAAEVAHVPPNVVIILIDDMGYADIGPFGATKQRTSQLDRMAREGTRATREAHYYFNNWTLQAIRQGQWKLALVPQKEATSGQVPEDASGTNPRLYDLDHDIGERVDVGDKHPDMVERLQALAKRMNAELGTTGSARRPAGVGNNSKPLYPMEEKAKDKAEK
jgi:arylsulfatase A-like enzyme